MSEKNRDEHKRKRNKTVAFRVSPEEARKIDRMVKMSGLSKQEYIVNRLMNLDVKVYGNPRVAKGLKTVILDLCEELTILNKTNMVPEPETMDIIATITKVINRMTEKVE